MATTKKEENIVVGVDNTPNPVQAEEDFLTGLLAATEYMEDEENHREIEIKRNGKKYFSFTVRPITQEEYTAARKKGVKLVKNPMNKKLPHIEDENAFNQSKHYAWLIYTATIEADREKVWGNPQLIAKLKAKGKDIMYPAETIPYTLLTGEIPKIIEVINEISGFDDEDTETVEDTVKN